jgi:hypothetical protein
MMDIYSLALLPNQKKTEFGILDTRKAFSYLCFLSALILILDSSALRICNVDDIQIGSGWEWSSKFNTNNEYKFGDNSIVDVEVNMNKKTIHYFINNNLCPYYHSDISSSPLLFGINAIYSNGII